MLLSSAVLSLMAVSSAGFSCPKSLPAISWSYVVTPKAGKEFRRVDVEVVTLEKVEVAVPDNRVYFTAQVTPDGFARVHIANKSNEHIEGLSIMQKLEGKLEGALRARRIVSKSPLIVEDFLRLAYTVEKDGIRINLPPIRPGEEIQLEYTMNAKILFQPQLLSPVAKSEKIQERVVRVHSFYFAPGQTRLGEKELEKLLMELSLLPAQGDFRLVVKGYADASGKRSVNARIARERATQVVNLLLKNSIACIEKDPQRQSLTGMSFDIR